MPNKRWLRKISHSMKFSKLFLKEIFWRTIPVTAEELVVW